MMSVRESIWPTSKYNNFIMAWGIGAWRWHYVSVRIASMKSMNYSFGTPENKQRFKLLNVEIHEKSVIARGHQLQLDVTRGVCACLWTDSRYRTNNFEIFILIFSMNRTHQNNGDATITLRFNSYLDCVMCACVPCRTVTLRNFMAVDFSENVISELEFFGRNLSSKQKPRKCRSISYSTEHAIHIGLFWIITLGHTMLRTWNLQIVFVWYTRNTFRTFIVILDLTYYFAHQIRMFSSSLVVVVVVLFGFVSLPSGSSTSPAPSPSPYLRLSQSSARYYGIHTVYCRRYRTNTISLGIVLIFVCAFLFFASRSAIFWLYFSIMYILEAMRFAFFRSFLVSLLSFFSFVFLLSLTRLVLILFARNQI